MKVILSFCAGCGIGPITAEDGPNCPNCNHPIIDRKGRIEGDFELEEAERFKEVK